MPHADAERSLRVQLATALREREQIEGTLASAFGDLRESEKRADAAESERDALRTALQDIVTLCMDVPATEDWRAKVGDRARLALHGPPAWEHK